MMAGLHAFMPLKTQIREDDLRLQKAESERAKKLEEFRKELQRTLGKIMKSERGPN